MPKKKDIHVVPHKDGWATKKEGNQKATKVYKRKDDAIKDGRKTARNNEVELIIHKKDGKIQDSDSYDNDPCPPKDKKH